MGKKRKRYRGLYGDFCDDWGYVIVMAVYVLLMLYIWWEQR